VQQKTSLSIANNAVGDLQLTTIITMQTDAAGNIFSYNTTVTLPFLLALASKTTYYIVAATPVGGDSIGIRGDVCTTKVTAVCAYL
jgi:hypothetical protein